MRSKTVIICVFLSLVGISSKLLGQWVQVASLIPLAHSFVSIGDNLFAGTENGLYVTTDFGLTWNSLGFDKQAVQPLFVKGTTLYACYYEIKPQAFYSVDYGKNWTLDSALSKEIVGFFIVKDTMIFASTSGGIFRSTNNGVSWDSVNVGINKVRRIINHDTVFTLPGFGLIGTTSTNIFVITNEGVYKSNNNGSSWTLVDSGISPDAINNAVITSMTVNDDNMFIGDLDGDLIYRWSEKDSTWIEVNNHNPILGGIECLASYKGNLFSGTDAGICMSTDNGINWKIIDEGFSGRPIVTTLAFCGKYIFASGNSTQGIWRRPLSDFGISTVKNPTQLDLTISLSPNPTTGIITVHNAPANMMHVAITNVLGETVRELTNSGATDFTIDLSKLPQGTYFARFSLAGSVNTRRIIRE